MSENILKFISNTIRGLSIDAINAANSGHPGLPMGCADVAAALFSGVINHNPKNPYWINRDRFILSAGHGSMLLYSCLHLAGFNITLNDIKNFRKLHSITAGHPEYNLDYGIETTTGPLGQGFGHAVGIALSQKMLAARFNTDEHEIFKNKTYVIAGDGCMMEGITAEAASFAGHHCLDNLVLIYDSNDICLDGPTSECFSEDVCLRFKSYGWDTITINGHNFDEIFLSFMKAKESKRPLLIEAKTIIGYGSPNRKGSAESHGKPLGDEETNLTKLELGIPNHPDFYIPENVSSFFKNLCSQQNEIEKQWNKNFSLWKKKNPELAEEFKSFEKNLVNEKSFNAIESCTIKPNLASRASSSQIIQVIHDTCPNIIGGSADLSCSDSTLMKKSGIINKEDFSQRNIKYGVREFAMGSIAIGLSLSGFFRPFCGTFFTFSDYMKNAIRLAAYMKLPLIYQFTHDSIYLGEDGPTHQSIEHLASLRSIPNLTVIRPADSNEVKGAWKVALNSQASPTALVLTRQSLNDLEFSSQNSVAKGAYIIKKEQSNNIDFCILASGSEVSLALEVSKQLESQNLSVRVVSFPSFECFNNQSIEYKNTILPDNVQMVVIEAQTKFGWHQYAGKNGLFFTVEDYGLSGPAKDVAQHFGFNSKDICTNIIQSTRIRVKNNS